LAGAESLYTNNAASAKQVQLKGCH